MTKDYSGIQIKVSTLAERRIAMFVLSALAGNGYEKRSMEDSTEDIDLYPFVRTGSDNIVDASGDFGRKIMLFSDLPDLWMEKSVAVKLNDKLTATVEKDKITVGCQTFSPSVVDDLQKAIKQVS